jgi:hypothetical protein
MSTTKYATGLSQPAGFEYQRNSSNVIRWNSWVRQFNTFIKAAGIKGDEAELNTFLYVVGGDVLEIYEAIVGTPKTKAEETIKVITGHFKPKERKDSAMLSFRKLQHISRYNYNNTNHHYQQGPHQYQKNGTNKFNQHQGQNKSNTCGMCGYEYSHKVLCPAQGKQCNSW